MGSAIEVLEAAYAHLNETGTAALQFMSEDIEWFNVDTAPEAVPYLGHSGVERWVTDYASALGGFRVENLTVEEIAPGVIVAFTRMSGVGPESEVPITLDLWTTWVIRAGLIRRAHGFMSEADARADAAGFT